MSRTLNDDFDEDDLPAGNLDLEKGSAQVGGGVPSNYGGDGIDFDDELYGSDEGPGASLELDLPKGGPGTGHGASAPTKGPVPHAPPPPAPRPGGGAPGAPGAPGLLGGVPDLAFDAKPPPRSSGNLPAGRPSGQQPAVRPSGQQHAAPPPAPPPAPAPSSPGSDGHHGFAPPAPSSSNVTMAPLSTPPPSSSGRLPAAHANAPAEPPPPLKPTSAALIAKYPDPPRAVANAPLYAIKVFMRQLELRTDLESLRRRRSPDVPLYEAALKAYDPKTFRLGMAINIAALTLATFIFFLPVILRFVRD